MSKLEVRTRGNSSPQGKARVYFSCHPEDFKRHFDIICQDIFATQNCAIYYDSELDKGNDSEELYTQLSDMQLFIMPLTTKFLFQPCRARVQEYAFALKHHIPVLPIAMEAEIGQYFAECMNKIKVGYGDIQFLNKVSTDYTEIPYEEKLKKILNNILVGDELANRVRSAFDSYIFLSYRKKDRSYAKELMKLIHSFPFCRDVAIWYDEFLVPGEKWNRAINDAIIKSSLVTLLVTPSIIEPDNFIIKHEYPDAVSAGKPIIPAEMVPTEHETLFRLFKGLSDPIDVTDKIALEEALHSIPLHESTHSPEHNFLIGLAYLSAIDVERDYERAVSLITSAAEAELPDAIEKLVSMYNTGEGVERNYLTAVELQEQLVQVMEKTLTDPLKTRDIISTLWDAGDMWSSLVKLDMAENAYERMRKYASERNMRYSSTETKRDLFASYNKLGNIFEAKGNLTLSLKYQEKALQLCEELAQESQTVEVRRDLSVSYNNLGAICEELKDLTSAYKYYKKALLISEELTKEIGTIEARRDLSFSYNKLGECFETNGNIQLAQIYYKKALQLRKELTEETETVELRRDLSFSYNKLGVIYQIVGDLKDAQDYFNKALRLRKELAQETGTVEARRDLSFSYNKLGSIYEAKGDLKCAQEYYGKDFQFSQQLAKETGTVNARQDFAISCNKLGEIFEAYGNLKVAQEYYEKALQLNKQLAEETETIEALRNLSVSYNNLGIIYKASKHFTNAKTYFEKALQLRKELAEKAGTLQAYDDLAVSYYLIGSMPNGNHEFLKKAHKIYCELTEKHPEIERYNQYREIIQYQLYEKF